MRNLLKPDLTFNRLAIMRAAIAIAREEHAFLKIICPGKKGLWRHAMAAGLRRAWIKAHVQRQDATAMADVAVFAADMIDSTATAVKAAIEAHAARLSA
jgi:hypothetical protein